MKISIVGPSCVGKTTLARRLAKEFKLVKHIDLDMCFNDLEYIKETGKFRMLSPEVGVKNVEEKLGRSRNWIVEGVTPVEEVFEQSDLIVYVKYLFLLPLFFQWKRFFTDKFQRDTYGLRNNLFQLTPDIIKQYFSRSGCNELNNPCKYSIQKYDKMLKRYNGKVIEVDNPNAMEVIVRLVEEKYKDLKQ